MSEKEQRRKKLLEEMESLQKNFFQDLKVSELRKKAIFAAGGKHGLIECCYYRFPHGSQVNVLIEAAKLASDEKIDASRTVSLFHARGTLGRTIYDAQKEIVSRGGTIIRQEGIKTVFVATADVIKLMEQEMVASQPGEIMLEVLRGFRRPSTRQSRTSSGPWSK